MRNVKENQQKACIFLTNEEYVVLVKDLTNGEVSCVFEYSGIAYNSVSSDSAYAHEYVNSLLSKYFDVDVQSVHVSYGKSNGVWICYS